MILKEEAGVSNGVTLQTVCNENKLQPSCQYKDLSQTTNNSSEKQTILSNGDASQRISSEDESQPSPQSRNFQQIGAEIENQSECMNLKEEKLRKVNGNITGRRAVPSENNRSNISNGNVRGETSLRTMKEKETKFMQKDNANNKSINGNVSDECCSKNIEGNNNSEGCNRSARSLSYADVTKSAHNSDKITTRNSLEYESSGKVLASNGNDEGSFVNGRSQTSKNENSNSCSEPPFPKKPSKLPPGKVNGSIAERECTKSVPPKNNGYQIPRFESCRNNSSKRNFNKKPERNFIPPLESVVEPFEDSAKLSSSNNCKKQSKDVISNGNPNKTQEQVDPKCHGAIPKFHNTTKNKHKKKNHFADANTSQDFEPTEHPTCLNSVENSMPSTSEFKMETFQDNNFEEKNDSLSLKNGNTDTVIPSADHFTAVEHVNSCQQEEFTELNVPGTTVNVEVGSTSCEQPAGAGEVNTPFVHVPPSYFQLYIPNSLNDYGYFQWSNACADDNINSVSVNGACGYDPNYSEGISSNLVPDSANGACGYDPDYFVRESSNNQYSPIRTNDTTKDTTVSKNSRLNPLAQEFMPTSLKNHCDNSVVSNSPESCNEFTQLSDQSDSNLVSRHTDTQSQLSSQVESDAPLQSSSQAGVDSQATNCKSPPVEDYLEEYLCYMFSLHANLCGALIGRKARFLNYIYSQASVDIHVSKGNPNSDMNVVTVAGKDSQVQIALEIIKKKFKNIPSLSFEQINAPSPSHFSSERLKTNLSVNVDFDVIITSTVLPNHFFIHLPTMASYHELPSMYNSMSFHYNNELAPVVVKLEVGNIVAAPYNYFGSVLWLRAEVTSILPDDKYEVKFLDMGGYQDYERKDLRKMHRAFMEFPFQAVECFLADVSTPENGWSEESIVTFESLTQNQVLKAVVAYHAEDGTPYILLYKIELQKAICINEILIGL